MMRCVLMLLLFSIVFTACVQPSLDDVEISRVKWAYADLRALDPPDAVSPSQDIIALYTHEQNGEFHIRLDLLDFSESIDHNLFIALDYAPGGETSFPLWDHSIINTDLTWNALLSIPASGNIWAIDAKNQLLPDLRMRVFRDPLLDTIEISFHYPTLFPRQAPIKMQVFLTPSDTPQISDSLIPVRSDAIPPGRVPLFIVIWNTFRGSTPAQALRSWDGAHTGPSSSRHGLLNLIEAAERVNAPIVLLDLESVATISTLDYMGVLPKVRELVDGGILVLPDVVSSNVVGSLDLCVMDFWGVCFIGVGFCCGFLGVYDYTQLSSENTNIDKQALLTGPSLEVRRLIALHATAGKPETLLLGGDLSQSTWGEPAASTNTLRYLAAHPWIHVLNSQDFPSLHPGWEHWSDQVLLAHDFIPFTPQGNTIPSALPVSKINEHLLDLLVRSPDNPITQEAWRTYFSLISPADPNLTELRANYLGLIGHMLAGAYWAAAPKPNSSCETDLDWDGTPECVLASNTTFSVIEPEYGYITFAYILSPTGIHQIVSPYFPFATGLSDASTWDPRKGIAGDPKSIPGAFVEAPLDWAILEISVQNSQISFTHPDQTMQKTYALIPDGIHVEYLAAEPKSILLPLVLDPWARLTPGWGDRYWQKTTTQGWSWGIDNEVSVEIKTQGDLDTQVFFAFKELLLIPEDPNYDYPPDFFLPIPMALANITASGGFTIDLRVKSP